MSWFLLPLTRPRTRLGICQHPIDFCTYLGQVCLQCLGILEFSMSFCFLYEGLKKSFLFEERLECVRNL